MKARKNTKGFTLIEVMVVVAIIGILAAIAYPSYMSTVRKSNRSDAKVELNDVAQRLQRCYTAYNAYNNANCGAADDYKNGGTTTSREGFYTISGVINATDYTMTATPVAGTTQASDVCETLTLANTGARGSTGATSDVCW